MDNINTDKCDFLSDPEISLYVDALIWDKLQHISQTVKDHVAECDVCANEVAALFDILSNEYKPEEQEHEYFAQKERRAKIVYFGKIAAVAASLIILLGLAFLFTPSEKNIKMNLAKQNSKTIQNNKNIFVDIPDITPKEVIENIDNQNNYENSNDYLAMLPKNSEMEEVIGNFRTRTLTDENNLYNPKDTLFSSTHNTILFYCGENEGCYIRILNYKNETVVGPVQIKNSFYLLAKDTRTLNDTTYYWQITNSRSGNIDMGKFWIINNPEK